MVANEKQVVNQSSISQYIREIDFEKDLIEKSVEYAVAYGINFHMMKQAIVTLEELDEHEERNVLD